MRLHLVVVLIGVFLLDALPGQAAAQVSEVATRGPRFLYAPSAQPRSDTAGTPMDAREAAVLRQRVSLDIDRVPIAEALREIARRGRLQLLYTSIVLPKERRVSLEAKQITVAAALTEVLLDTGIDVVLTRSGHMTLVQRRTPRRVAVDTGTVLGRVTNVNTGEALEGAEVFIEGTRWTSSTGADGRYRLAGVDTGSHTLAVRRLGYAKQSRRIVVRHAETDTVDFMLEPAATKLDELVTTATGEQRRREVANAVTTIQADSVMQTAVVRNLTDLLEHRVPGLTAQGSSGAPGDPSRMRLRGLGSVLRSNDPVVIVDGVRIYAAQADARSGNLTNQLPNGSASARTAAPSPLDQIDPNTIEKIEVFKGASATTIYGADAANGVIVITTKRGRPGPLRWDARIEHGRTYSIGKYDEGYYRWGSSRINNNSVLCASVLDVRCEEQDSLLRFQALNDPALTPLDQGNRTRLSLTASGGSQTLAYSFTGTFGNETGLLKLPEYEAERFRSRLSVEPPDWMMRPHQLESWSVASNILARLGATAEVTVTTSLSRSRQERTELERRVVSLAGSYIDTLQGLYYVPDGDGTGSQYGFSSDILKDYYEQATASTITFRTGIAGRWQPVSWFHASANAGIDLVPREDVVLLRPGLISFADSGQIGRGVGRSMVGTFNIQGSFRKPLGKGFRFETNIGANLASTDVSDLLSSADHLRPGTETFAGARNYVIRDRQTNTSVFGYYIEPRISGDRFTISAGLRLDGGSAYGSRISSTGGLGNLLGLPKLGGAWVISEEPWFPAKSLFSSLRLRGAYGQAQVQPGPADRLRLYGFSTLDGASVGLVELGNTELRPERTAEFEGGFEADMLDSRISLAFTGYRKKTIDALFDTRVPGSVAGGGSMVTNIGNILNTGLELTLGVTPVRLPAIVWTANLTYSRNTNTLTKLGRGVVENRPQGIVEGYPVGGRWAKPILGYADENGDGVLAPSEIVVGDTLVYMGRLLPEHLTSLYTDLGLFNGAVSVSAGFSYQSGAMQIDDAIRQNAPLVRGLMDPGAPLGEQAAVLASMEGGDLGQGFSSAPGGRTEYGLMSDVSTFRFQSISLMYHASERVAKLFRAARLSVGIQGDNLGVYSAYRGKDPNVSAWNVSGGEDVRDTGQLPRPRTWQVVVSLGY